MVGSKSLEKASLDSLGNKVGKWSIEQTSSGSGFLEGTCTTALSKVVLTE